MKIWIHINDVQEGPYEISELPLDRMDASTPVWYEGLEYWQPAGEAQLTEHLFDGFHAAQQQVQIVETSHSAAAATATASVDKCPPTYLWWSVILTLIAFINPLGLIAIVYGWLVKRRWDNFDKGGALRASETAAWWVIILIVTDLMFIPLSLLVSI